MQHGDRATSFLRALLLAGLVLVPACEAAPIAGAACTRASECRAPLVCSYGRCRAECAETRDCPIGARCIAAAGLGVCTLDVENHCDGEVCPSPLRCVDDECRTGCSENADCISGVCVGSACVEPVSGSDAGTPADASVPGDAFAVDDAGVAACDLAPSESLAALLGASGAGRGLRATFRRVADVAQTGPRALAVASLGAGELAGSYVATIDGETPHLFRATTEDGSFEPVPLWTGDDQTTAASSIDVSTSDERLLVMLMRQPADGSAAFAWATDATDVAGLTVHPLTPGHDVTGETFQGETAIVGGTSPFGGGPIDLYYVFHTELGGVGTIGATDWGRSADYWRTPPTPGMPMFTSPQLEMVTGRGPLVLFRDPVSRAVAYWQPGVWGGTVRNPTDATAEIVPLRADTSTLPGIASSLDGVNTVLAWPSGNHVELTSIACPTSACMSSIPLGTVSEGTSPVVATALTALASGYLLAVGRANGTVDLLRLDDAASVASPFAAVSTFVAGAVGQETIRRLDLTATPTTTGASVLLAVLADEGTARHLWTASYAVCDP